ncbi:MAG: sodium:calcium antiporter [Deltaproteobacteria bacterium]|nr:sodium:calcium antiporter [Deltaproteobacteria bacterium]MBZ0220056.1 sodium:calcium antiporter [Deltaproteobacteria bacterium]
MIQEILLLVFWLVVIVIAAEVFTNAIESLGARLKFSEGVTGSIFAAVGTALPETMVPLVAIFGGNSAHVREEVGVGAILGAPFMLSTLAMFLIGAALWQFQGTRKKANLTPERSGFRRDIEFFLFAFTLAFLVAFTPQEYRLLRVFIAAVLVITYFYYILETVKASAALVEDGHATENSKPLYLGVVLKDRMYVIVLQLLIALGLIIAGAKGFVHGVEYLSEALRLPVMALSLLIIPVATELPEKVNSIIWVRKGKDTMALGNITGAMVFQGTLLPAIGIFLTPWTVNLTVVASSALTITAGIWLYFIAMRVKRIAPWLFIVNGALYMAFVYIVLVTARS